MLRYNAEFAVCAQGKSVRWGDGETRAGLAFVFLIITLSHDLGLPVVPGGQEKGLGSRNLRPRAEARLPGRVVSKERLGDGDGQMKFEPPFERKGVPRGQTESGVVVLAVIC